MNRKTTDDIFKKYAEASNEIIETKKSKLESLGLDIESLKFKVNDDNYENLKNFFRFYILIAKKIINDFDSDPVVIEAIEKRYTNSKYSVKHTKKRYFSIDDIYIFETDTANSFKTIFYQFLRDYYSEEFYEYLKYNGNKTSDFDRYVYLLKKLEKNEFKFKKEHKDLIKLFNTLAGLYHSLNNVVLVPYGYNITRSQKYKDIYCLSIANLVNSGFNKDLLKTIGRVKSFDYDEKFYEEIKKKTRVSGNKREKLTLEQYQRYLEETINFIQEKL